jgi:hypothetical protein
LFCARGSDFATQSACLLNAVDSGSEERGLFTDYVGLRIESDTHLDEVHLNPTLRPVERGGRVFQPGVTLVLNANTPSSEEIYFLESGGV